MVLNTVRNNSGMKWSRLIQTTSTEYISIYKYWLHCVK